MDPMTNRRVEEATVVAPRERMWCDNGDEGAGCFVVMQSSSNSRRPFREYIAQANVDDPSSGEYYFDGLPPFVHPSSGKYYFDDLPPLVHEHTTSYSSPSWVEAPKSVEDNNVIETVELKPQGQASNYEGTGSGSSGGSTPQFSSGPAKVEQHNHIKVETKHDIEGLSVWSASSSASSSSPPRSALLSFAEITEHQEACFRAWFGPDQSIPYELMRDSHDAMKNHYAPGVETFFGNPAHTVAPRPGRISGFSQILHHGVGLNGRSSELQFLLDQIKNPANHSIRLIHTKGHIPAISVDPYGSRFIQNKLGTATPGEIMMVYLEIMPHVRTLVVDAFANYFIRKLLEHGPPFCRKEIVGNLLGHVFGLSLHLYGCRVIQKAFQVSGIDQQIKMAMELGSNILKCVLDQYANNVVQQCMESVPPQYIQFIYRSLCGKAKMLSSHPYGFHVIQKTLEFCNDMQILHALVSEIVECVNELSADRFGNYIVQYILEHGGGRFRQIIMLKFAGRIVQMSCQKYSSYVIEKCLLYSSYQDRQLITTEILRAGDGRTADHLLGLMIHPYANYVVQRMIDTADECQFNMIMDVVKCNISVLIMYIHGRHVILQDRRLLNERPRRARSLAPPRLLSLRGCLTDIGQVRLARHFLRAFLCRSSFLRFDHSWNYGDWQQLNYGDLQ